MICLDKAKYKAHLGSLCELSTDSMLLDFILVLHSSMGFTNRRQMWRDFDEIFSVCSSIKQNPDLLDYRNKPNLLFWQHAIIYPLKLQIALKSHDPPPFLYDSPTILTVSFAYLIPLNIIIALKLTKLLIFLLELAPDHRSHHTLTLRHDLNFITINPIVFAPNQQLLSLLAVQNRSSFVLRSVRQKLPRHFRFFDRSHRPQENYFLSPHAA